MSMAIAARFHFVVAFAFAIAGSSATAQDQAAVQVDRQAREVRVLCEALRPDMPLEYICVVFGNAEHESLLRTRVQPSAVHTALLGLGLEPGRPLRYNAAADQWLPPTGPPLHISVEWQSEAGETIRHPLGEVLRGVDGGRPMPTRTFVFVGSQMFTERAGTQAYAADATGQLVSLVNFEFPTIDVAELKSNANETLEWEVNPETAPPAGARVWMILSPIAAESASSQAITQPATQPATRPAFPIIVSIDAGGTLRVGEVTVTPQTLATTLLSRESGENISVRLTVARGAPVAIIGQAIGALVGVGISDVTFVPVEDNAAVEDGMPPVLVLVHDGGRAVTFDGRSIALADWVRMVTDAPADDRAAVRVRVRARPGARDVAPVDLAAPAAVLYALGYADVQVEVPAPGDADPLDALRREWERRVMPQADALRSAAQIHYDVMQAYQDEINRLLDEADALRREMDELQRRFDELTTPQPTLPGAPVE